MAASSTFLVLISLLCQLTGPAVSGALKELVGALGGSVTFPLNITGKQVDTVVWSINTTVLVTIQPIGNKQPKVIVTQNRNKERMEFPPGGELKLSNLKKSDSGAYCAQIYSSSSPPITQEYVLRVYEHLSKPKVIVGLQSSKNGSCTTNLTCFMEHRGEDVTYSWKVLGEAANETHDNSILPVSWNLGEKDMTFICIARNPISSNSSSPILVRKLCEGDPDSSMVFLCFPLMLMLLIILVLGLVLLCMQKERRIEFIKEKKRMDIHQEIPNFCPNSGETTEYDTIPYADMEEPYPLSTTPDPSRTFSYEHVI
ncbi:SLAM family member 7 isoform X2 [Nycticebus coucang]|uniref:SLAM family member 7 isoform X2 n=1 Tax=Nycticebus coucang TaxID=9470 RepID=UPI00234E1FA0|nr:SLAM family member 7 isoform X2 [Nycticebus coucang]